MIKIRSNNTEGFTIVEIMIATMVLSIILLISTTLIIGIGNLYYKGVTQTNVQDAVRNVSDEIASQLKLSNQVLATGNDTAIPKINIFCVGNTRYSYVTDAQLGKQQQSEIDGSFSGPVFYHALWRDVPNGGCHSGEPGNSDGAAANLTDPTLGTHPGDGTELVPPNSQLTAFSITGTSSYKIQIEIASGSPDLFTGGKPAGINTTCNSGIGDQFCATSSLDTIVLKRL